MSRGTRWGLIGCLPVASLLMLSTSSGVFADDSLRGGDVAGLFGKQAQVYGAFVWAYLLLAAALAILLKKESALQSSDPQSRSARYLRTVFRINLCCFNGLPLLLARRLRLAEGMSKRRANQLRDSDIVGLKYFDRLMPLLERLHGVGVQRDRAGNRQLFFDHYCPYLLLFLFNPIVDSLRGIQPAIELKKVHKNWAARVSLGSLSEAVEVFDPEPVQQIAGELAAQLEPLANDRSFPEVSTSSPPWTARSSRPSRTSCRRPL